MTILFLLFFSFHSSSFFSFSFPLPLSLSLILTSSTSRIMCACVFVCYHSFALVARRAFLTFPSSMLLVSGSLFVLSVFRSCAIRLLSNHITFLSFLIIIEFFSLCFSFFPLFFSPSRFSCTTLNANILEEKRRTKQIFGTEQRGEENNDECSSKRDGLYRILSHSISSLHLSIYPSIHLSIYLCVFVFFFFFFLSFFLFFVIQ